MDSNYAFYSFFENQKNNVDNKTQTYFETGFETYANIYVAGTCISIKNNIT